MTYGFNISARLVAHEKNLVATYSLLHQIRWDSARAMSLAFPGELRRFAIAGLPVSTLSKWRRGYLCSPLYRMCLAIVALSLAGAPEEQAQVLIDQLQSLKNRLYGEKCATSPGAAARAPRMIA